MRKMESIKLEYMGYTSIISRNENLNGRYSGGICEPGETEEMDSWGFAADDVEEAQSRFESQVEKIIDYKL